MAETGKESATVETELDVSLFVWRRALAPVWAGDCHLEHPYWGMFCRTATMIHQTVLGKATSAVAVQMGGLAMEIGVFESAEVGKQTVLGWVYPENAGRANVHLSREVRRIGRQCRKRKGLCKVISHSCTPLETISRYNKGGRARTMREMLSIVPATIRIQELGDELYSTL